MFRVNLLVDNSKNSRMAAVFLVWLAFLCLHIVKQYCVQQKHGSLQTGESSVFILENIKGILWTF